MSLVLSTGSRKRKGETLVQKAAKRILNRAKTTARRNMGMPATRGFRGQYGKYRRSGKEKKIIDLVNQAAIYESAATVASTSVWLLNGVSQGSDYTNRIGRKITMTSVFFRCTSSLATSPNAISIPVRIMIVYDEQTNGADPAGTDLLQTPANAMALTNLSNRDRFKILYDKIRTINTQGTTDGALADKLYLSKYIKMSLPVIFNGTGNTSGAIQTGGLYMFFISNATAGTPDNRPKATFSSRVRFIDD